MVVAAVVGAPAQMERSCRAAFPQTVVYYLVLGLVSNPQHVQYAADV
jgi:hypothetical protein